MSSEITGPMGWLGDSDQERDRATSGALDVFKPFGDSAGGNLPLPGIEAYIREQMDREFGTVHGWDFTVAERRLYGDILWTEQPNGNCVGSSAAVAAASRTAHDIFAIGDAESPFGTEVWGIDSGIPFIPFIYGGGRHLGGFTGNGDGSWGTTQLESMLKHGWIDCEVVRDKYPKTYPQSNSSTNKLFGKNFNECSKYLDEAAAHKLVDSEVIDNFEELWDCLTVRHMPAIIASSWGFGYWKERDGLKLYKHDRTWQHQMSIRKALEFTRDGSKYRYVWVGNQWGQTNHSGDCGFWIDESTAAKWIPKAFCAGIGQVEANPLGPAPKL